MCSGRSGLPHGGSADLHVSAKLGSLREHDRGADNRTVEFGGRTDVERARLAAAVERALDAQVLSLDTALDAASGTDRQLVASDRAFERPLKMNGSETHDIANDRHTQTDHRGRRVAGLA